MKYNLDCKELYRNEILNIKNHRFLLEGNKIKIL